MSVSRLSTNTRNGVSNINGSNPLEKGLLSGFEGLGWGIGIRQFGICYHVERPARKVSCAKTMDVEIASFNLIGDPVTHRLTKGVKVRHLLSRLWRLL